MANQLIKDLEAIAAGLGEEPEAWGHIPCPTCRRGGLALVAGSLVTEEANTSKVGDEPQYAEIWEPDWVYGGFHFMMVCRKSSCDLVRVMGAMRVQRVQDSEWPEQYETVYMPTQFLPALPLLEHVDLCPRAVRERVDAAARVLWLDPNSAANRLRSATEAVMDDQGIPGEVARSGGKKATLHLHDRIEIFKETKPDYVTAADFLMAVKWVGNVGSHRDGLDIFDVLDGVELFDHALNLLYDTTGDVIERKAAQITARKGMPEAYSARPSF